MRPLARLRGSNFGILTGHFLGRYFENEMVAPAGELRSGIAGILGVVAVPGLFLPLFLMEKYSTFIVTYLFHRNVDRDLATLPDKYIFLALAFVIPGLAALLKWQTLFPDRKDHAILAPLPVRLRTIFLSKLTALAVFVLLFALAVNLAGSLLFPLIVLGDTGTLSTAVLHISAQLLTTMAASVFAALLVVCANGVLANVMPARLFRRITPWVEFALLVFLLAQLFLAPRVSELLTPLRTGPLWRAALFPPLWFLGLNEIVIGRSPQRWGALATLATRGLASAFLLSALFYLISYRRHFRKTAEMLDSGARATRRWLPLPSDPQQAAIVEFVRQTLFRHPAHRLLFSAFLGVGGAILVDGLAVVFVLPVPARTSEILLFALSAPLVVSFFLLTSLRFLLDIPAERPAHWIFRLTLDSRSTPGMWRGARRSLFELALLPATLFAIPVNVALWGPGLGLAHTLFCLLVGAFLLEALLLRYRKLPFSSVFGSARSGFVVALLGWYIVFSIYSYTTIRIEYRLWARPLEFFIATLIVAALSRLILLARPWLLEGEPEALIVDEAEPAVQTLNLQAR